MNHDTSNKLVNNTVYKYAIILKDSFKLIISASLAGVMLRQLPNEITEACENPFVHFFIFLNLIEHDKSMRILRAAIGSAALYFILKLLRNMYANVKITKTQTTIILCIILFIAQSNTIKIVT